MSSGVGGACQRRVGAGVKMSFETLVSESRSVGMVPDLVSGSVKPSCGPCQGCQGCQDRANEKGPRGQFGPRGAP